MPSNDPTDTGGLFIGRRPGTAPVRPRERAPSGSGARRRIDAVFAGSILMVEGLLLATLWGPQPAGWLWIGSHIFHATGSVTFGILVAFAGMLATILMTIALAMRLDRAWKLARRASGREQRKGLLEPIFVTSMVVGGLAFMIWFLLIQAPAIDAPQHPGASAEPAARVA